MRKKSNKSKKAQMTENEEEYSDCPPDKLPSELYRWTNRFNATFFKHQPVAVQGLFFARARHGSPEHYVQSTNSLEAFQCITINPDSLNEPPEYFLAMVLHEMCHRWQNHYGTPSTSWFHNKEFQVKMLEFGIFVDSKGHHIALRDPFVCLLEKHGIRLRSCMNAIGIIGVPPKPKPKNKSKLKKWTCGCTNIRVAVKDLKAKCLKCSNHFELME